MNTPDKIKQAVEEKYKVTERVGYGFIESNHKKINSLRVAATFGYSLAAKEMEEKDKEIERLKGLIEKIWRKSEKQYLICTGVIITSGIMEEIDDYWNDFAKENNL